MGAPKIKKDLWDTTLNWMEKIHGQSLQKDKKAALRILLHHLNILMDEVASVLEQYFVPLDIKAIEETGITPLTIPNNLSLILGCSYILQSEAKEELRSIFDPVDLKNEVSSSEEDNIEDPLYMHEKKNPCDASAGENSNEGLEDVILQTRDTQSIVPRTEASAKKRQSKNCSDNGISLCRSDLVATSLEIEYPGSTCFNCHKSVKKTMPNYYLHIKVNEKTTTASAWKADSGFEKVSTLRSNDVSCSKCNFAAKSTEEYLESNHCCEPNNQYRCLRCDLVIQGEMKKEFVCEICGARFPRKTSCVRHMRRTHSAPSDRMPCPYCGKEYKNRYYVNAHLKNNCKKVPSQGHPCQFCGKIFRTYVYLEKHLRREHRKKKLT